jgi:thioredoxin 1
MVKKSMKNLLLYGLILIVMLSLVSCKPKVETPLIWTLTESNFSEVVLKSDKPVIVDFWAVWCMPCKVVEPILDKFSREYEGKVLVGKVNVDENKKLTMNYGIRSIPAVYIFSNGKVVQKLIAPQSMSELTRYVDPMLTK